MIAVVEQEQMLGVDPNTYKCVANV